MMPRLRRSTSRRGAAAIEFGLWLPVLMIAFAGALDLSWWMMTQSAVSRAVREGCRWGAAINQPLDPANTTGIPTPADFALLAEQTEAYATDVLDQMTENVGGGCGGTAGCLVDATTVYLADEDPPLWWLTVTVEYPYESFTGMIPALDEGITAEFTMVTQLQATPP